MENRLAAILAADVVGYAAMMSTDEAETHRRLINLREQVIQPLIAKHRGRIVKLIGDGLLVEFASIIDSVNCALDWQRDTAKHEAESDNRKPFRFRIGINLGDVIIDGDDIYGDGVNIASRLEGLASPGGICFSAIVREAIRNKLDIEITDLGDQSLKNIAEPVRVFGIEQAQVVTNGEESSRVDAIFRRPAVAVLPFENLSGDPEQEYFADGLSEDIITALTLWHSFPVIARNSTFGYKNKAPDVRRVGEELGARYVLEGSVRKAADRIRVTAQLINSRTGHHVWAERYDRQLTDIFKVQDEITNRIVVTLMPELERAERARSTSVSPANMDAWDSYLHGIAHLNDLSAEAIPRARAMFEQALRLDPKYAKAHAKLALSYHRELWLNVSDDSEKAIETMCFHANKSLELDDSDAFAHAVHALALSWRGDMEFAVQEARRAASLNPIDIDAVFSAGQMLAWNGQPEQGIPYMQNALLISPHDPRLPLFYSQLGATYFDAGDFENALIWACKAIHLKNREDVDPNTALAKLIRLASIGHLGKFESAISTADNVDALERYLSMVQSILEIRRIAKTRERIIEGLHKANLLT